MNYKTRLAILLVLLPCMRAMGGELPTVVYVVPTAVRAAIVENAKLDHPDDYDMQQFVVRRQMEAYQALAKLSSKPGISSTVYSRIKNRVDADHPDDYSTQLFVINRQVAAYRTLEKMSTPPGVANSDFFRMKATAKTDHPDDYATHFTSSGVASPHTGVCNQ